MDDTTGDGVLNDHWYWRPGWSVGTRYLTWHLTWEEHPELHAHARRYRQALARFEGLAAVPDQWLHLTMQGVGHAEELTDAELRAVVEAAHLALAAVNPPRVTFGAPEPFHEGVAWVVDPAGPVAAVRDATRTAIDIALGGGRRPADSAWSFVPHVTLAYATGEVPVGPVVDAVTAVKAPPVELTVRAACLIELHRDNRQYEWRTVARVPIG